METINNELAEAEAIANIPAVHELLQVFSKDPLPTRGTMIVREVMRALVKQVEASHVGDVEKKELSDPWVAAIRSADNLCPHGLSTPDKWRWKAERLRGQLATLAQRAGGGANPVAYADPKAFMNFEAAREAGERCTRGREWMWAHPDAGLVPLYAAPPSQPDSERDAARWRHLRAQHESANADALCVFKPGSNQRLVPVGSMPGELDATVDAMAAQHNETGGAK